jgi:hypothetical protein
VGDQYLNRLRKNFDMCKAVSNTFVLRRQGPGTKEVSKVQQGFLASRETEAVEIDFGMSTDVSKGPLAG